MPPHICVVESITVVAGMCALCGHRDRFPVFDGADADRRGSVVDDKVGHERSTPWCLPFVLGQPGARTTDII